MHMLMPRLILIALLMVSPMLSAQVAGTHEAEAQKRAIKAQPAQAQDDAQTKKGFEADADPLQITISFVKQRHGKVTIERSYTVTATTNLANPQIRDDSR